MATPVTNLTPILTAVTAGQATAYTNGPYSVTTQFQNFYSAFLNGVNPNPATNPADQTTTTNPTTNTNTNPSNPAAPTANNLASPNPAATNVETTSSIVTLGNPASIQIQPNASDSQTLTTGVFRATNGVLTPSSGIPSDALALPSTADLSNPANPSARSPEAALTGPTAANTSVFSNVTYLQSGLNQPSSTTGPNSEQNASNTSATTEAEATAGLLNNSTTTNNTVNQNNPNPNIVPVQTSVPLPIDSLTGSVREGIAIPSPVQGGTFSTQPISEIGRNTNSFNIGPFSIPGSLSIPTETAAVNSRSPLSESSISNSSATAALANPSGLNPVESVPTSNAQGTTSSAVAANQAAASFALPAVLAPTNSKSISPTVSSTPNDSQSATSNPTPPQPAVLTNTPQSGSGTAETNKAFPDQLAGAGANEGVDAAPSTATNSLVGTIGAFGTTNLSSGNSVVKPANELIRSNVDGSAAAQTNVHQNSADSAAPTPAGFSGTLSQLTSANGTLNSVGNNSAAFPSLTSQVAEGINAQARTMANGDRTDFQLRINPPELGPIQIRLSSGSDGISAHLIVSDLGVKQMIQDQLPDLRQRLQDSGLSLTGFSISADARSGGGTQQQNSHTPRSAVPAEGMPSVSVNPPSRSVVPAGSLDITI